MNIQQQEYEQKNILNNNLECAAITSAHEITQLKVPLYADPRRAAELSCHFQMDDQKLHSVKWYRDLHEIFRYNPSQKTQIRLFNVTGIMVQGGACETDSCVVRVMPPPEATRAAYTCEPEPWQHIELSPPLPGGLRASWRVLRVRVPPAANGALRLRCEAILMVEPPVLRDATATITIYSRTQLSKFVSNKGGNLYANANALFALFWTFNVISKFTSL
ncbi:hypothetical protein MSG28_004169 [Choristoneura fumiferana]|uniref:Uncharacterized protein n=1 Tax=Choristoneura fumiferana TaxID=7141 RepID=A0ACC0KHR6_CHOFU|nr:hypothetical protein MSG28_004169 [Choristoneura fumiferana]